MTPLRKLILGGSLAANAVLAVMLPRESATSVPAEPRRPSAEGSGTSEPQVETHPVGAAFVAARVPPIPDLVSSLRDAGLDAVHIRIIARAFLDDQRNRMNLGLTRSTEDTPYWKKSGNEFDIRAYVQLRDESRAKQAKLDELLGPDPSDPTVFTALNHFEFAGLPPAKVQELLRIHEDYQAIFRQLHPTYNHVPFPEDRQTAEMLEKEKDKDIQALLTPTEFAEYALRGSPTAEQVRTRLASLGSFPRGGQPTMFVPTEDEFRTIVHLQQDYDRSNIINYRIGGATPSPLPPRAGAPNPEAEVIAKIKASLDPTRGELYEKAIRTRIYFISPRR